MKKVIFKQIKIRNFLSIGEDPVLVRFNTGLNVITGNNRDKEDRRNGVGKSTIADAINFAIFGSTLRDIKNENIVNDSTSGSCEVILEFSIETGGKIREIKIIRSLNPSAIHLHIDNVDKTLDSIGNNNECISKLLNCTQEVFDNCVIMTLNNTIPFMGKKKQDKRKFIENIFNLGVFSKMLTKAKDEYSQCKKDFDIQSSKLGENISTLSTIKAQQLSFNDRKKVKISQLEAKIAGLIATQKTLTAIYEKLESIDFNSKKSEIQARIQDLLAKKIVEDTKISTLIVTIATLAVESSGREKTLFKIAGNIDECPVCLRIISGNDKSHIDSEKKRITDEVANLKCNTVTANNDKKACLDQKTVYDTEVSKENIKIFNIDKLQRQSADTKQLLDNNQSSIKLLQDQITDTITETASYDTVISELEAKILVVTEYINGLKSTLQLLDRVKFVLSEEGVKSYLIKRILDVLNNRLSYYLKKLDANCSCVFNEYFEELIINDKNKPCSYFNFSGAERKNIDLACLFTFMDIRRLQGDVTFNISIYDELLDSSLDERGIELVIDILRERVETYAESIFIISHRKESARFVTGEIVMLEKFNGITRRVDFKPDSN